MQRRTKSKGLDEAGMQRLSKMTGLPIRDWSEMGESFSSISAQISFSNHLVDEEDGHNDCPILYWRSGIGGIEFIAEDEWQLRYAMHHPEEKGLTWRWFSDAYPILWRIMQQDFDHDLDEVFDMSMVPGFDEGDFPPWEISDAECPVPDEICQRYGKLLSSVLNGPYVFFPPEKKQSLFRALRKDGYRVLRRPPI